MLITKARDHHDAPTPDNARLFRGTPKDGKHVEGFRHFCAAPRPSHICRFCAVTPWASKPARTALMSSTTETRTPEKRWEQVAALLEASVHTDYIGESVSQLEHMLQCAYFAAQRQADDALVLAALLHDVGHLCAGPNAPQMAGLGVVRHEHIGADYLRGLGFSERVCTLVAGHVDAKRYLALRKAGYLGRLSEASLGTLRHQGGPMTEEEARRFEAQPQFEDMLKVRMWDEEGKQAGLAVPHLAAYQEMALRDLRQSGTRT